MNMAQQKERVKELEAKSKGMKKKINPKAVNMTDRLIRLLALILRAILNCTTLQCRKARSRAEEDVDASPQRQGEDRADY